MTPHWQAVGVFCEDLREEKSGQEIIIGVMPDNLHISQLPALIPKLGVYFRIHLYPTTSIRLISTKIRFSDKSELELGSFDQTIIEKTQSEARANGAPVTGLISRGVLSPLNIPGPGRILAIAVVDGQELVCGSLNISEAVSPSATTSAPYA